MDAFIVSSFGTKGGVGKTTYIWNVGWRLHQFGFKVLMYDADPEACSLSDAYASLSDDQRQGAPLVRIYTPEVERTVLSHDAKNNHFILIDTKGGADDERANSAVSIADLIVSTFIPSKANLKAMPRTVKKFKELARINPKAQIKFLLTGLDERKKHHTAAMSRFVENDDLPFFRTPLHVSGAVEETLGDDSGPLTGFAGASGYPRANLEVSALADELVDLAEPKLGLRTDEAAPEERVVESECRDLAPGAQGSGARAAG